MRTTKVVSITLPPALLKRAKALAREENRTMSELMREAFRRYESDRSFERIRAAMVPMAERLGVRTEEDVVRLVRELRRDKQAEEEAESPKKTGTR